MAPEVMKAKNHSYAVDFFALGIIGYEFMLGRRPYNGPSRREIKEQMLSKSVEITFGELLVKYQMDGVKMLLIFVINYFRENLN